MWLWGGMLYIWMMSPIATFDAYTLADIMLTEQEFTEPVPPALIGGGKRG